MNALNTRQSIAASQGPETQAERVTICFPFAGDSIGGSHFSLLGLLQNLDPARFRVLIVLEDPNGKIAELFSAFEQIEDPARPEKAFTPGEKFNVSKFMRTLTGLPARRRLLGEHGVDIVHTNDGRTHASWALAARLAGIPLVWHHRADPDALGLRLLAPLLASKVLTVSSFSLPKGRVWSAAHKAQVIFSPFDISISADRAMAQARILEKAGLAQDALLLGYFGSFIARKRPFLFVDVIAELRKRHSLPVYGLMFGEAIVPEMEVQLRDHIKAAGMEDAVRLMGFQSPGHEWIAGCDQLIVPAVGEPLGRTLIEAMLVRTPVIATRSGGNAEALADGCGILVDPESATCLADAVDTARADPEGTEQMLDHAQISARERFGTQRHAASVMQVYEELLRRS